MGAAIDSPLHILRLTSLAPQNPLSHGDTFSISFRRSHPQALVQTDLALAKPWKHAQKANGETLSNPATVRLFQGDYFSQTTEMDTAPGDSIGVRVRMEFSKNKSSRLEGLHGAGQRGPTLHLWLREGLPESSRYLGHRQRA